MASAVLAVPAVRAEHSSLTDGPVFLPAQVVNSPNTLQYHDSGFINFVIYNGRVSASLTSASRFIDRSSKTSDEQCKLSLKHCHSIACNANKDERPMIYYSCTCFRGPSGTPTSTNTPCREL